MTYVPWSEWDTAGRLVERKVRSHKALAFGPSGELLASNLQSAGGRTLAVSVDGGATFTDKTAPDVSYSIDNVWVTAAGSLIANCAGILYRSSDIGATWSAVLDLGQPTVSLLANGLTEGPSGTLYVAAYSTTVGAYPAGNATVYTSANDGATWGSHSTFPSTMDGGTGDFAVRHLHSIHVLPSGLYVTSGDNNSECAIWKWGGAAWVRATPAQTNAEGAQRWRTVSLQERDGRIYWARDTGGASQGEVGWAPTSDLGDYTQVSTLETGVFYSAQLSDGTLLFGGSAEGGVSDVDQVVRLWAVDSADAVTVLWSEDRHPDATGSQYGVIASLDVDSSDNILFGGRYLAGLDNPGGNLIANLNFGDFYPRWT